MSVAAIPADTAQQFFRHAVEGHSKLACRLALELLDTGVPEGAIITDVLAASQRHVGDQWHHNELSVAEEHLATGVAQAALHALADACDQTDAPGLFVVACAEGDWHSAPAHMFAEALRAEGASVAFLGASTPAEHVEMFIARRRPEALLVSCNISLFFKGIPPLVDAAHGCGIPVLAGGRALQHGSARAARLGADGCANSAAEAMGILAEWRRHPPVLADGPVPIDLAVASLESRADELATSALAELARRFPAMAGYDSRQLARSREDLAFIVQFLAAAALVEDDLVFLGFLDWLATLLRYRRVPLAALTAGIEALQPLVVAENATGGRLCRAGLEHLAA